MEKLHKIIVAHPGQQHSFKTAAALKKANLLYKYFTTVYYKKNSITNILSEFLKGDDSIRVNKRRCNDLLDIDIIQKYEILGLLTILFSRIFKNQKWEEKWNNWVVDIFGRKVANFAIKNNVDAVISYDNNSGILFEKLESKDIIRILDVSAANRLYMQGIYNNDLKLIGDFVQLYGNTQLIKQEKLVKRYENEIRYTDYFIVGSKFVEKSLLFSGVERSQIKIVPYGVDIEKFKFNLKKLNDSETIKFIFVGNVSSIKGIYYLLEAFKKLNNKNIQIDIIGKFNGPETLLEPYIPFCNFRGSVPNDRMPELYKEADILVFPSLGEGFSLVVLEAMASGLPVIVSKNAGSSDAIVEGKNGFVIDIQSVNTIIEKVTWFTKNKDKIEEMSVAARETALEYSWRTYNEKLTKAVYEIVDLKNKKRK